MSNQETNQEKNSHPKGNPKPKSEKVDYFKLYANISDTGFAESLGLEPAEVKLISLLYEQRDEGNPLYIPELALEGLVHSGNTPYKALRTLHKLRERRIILYELCHEISAPNDRIYESIIYAPLEKAAKYHGVNLKNLLDENEETVEVVARKYRRVALFNVEYTVVYFCLLEEATIDEVPEGVQQELYDAIADGAIAEVLEHQYPVILEFMNYVQSIFGQTLTEVPREETEDESPEADNDLSGSGGLAGRDDTGGDRSPVQQTQEQYLSMDPKTGVGRSSGWENPQETQSESQDRQQTADGANAGDSTPVGIGK